MSDARARERGPAVRASSSDRRVPGGEPDRGAAGDAPAPHGRASAVRQPERVVRWAILLAAVALVAYLCLAILGPFVEVIAWSTVLAIAFHPVQQRLVEATRRPSLSALICTALVVVTILIPLAFVAALAINQLIALRDYLQQTFTGGTTIWTIDPLRELWEWAVRRAGLEPDQAVETMRQHASEIGALAAEYSLAFATNITGALVSFVFIIFATFFLLRDGARIAAGIPDYLPFERAQSERVLRRTREVIYASVYGVLVIAAIQGLLIGLSFSVLRIPSAALWGVVTVFTSVIPMLGAGAVWVPGVIYLLLTGHWIKAILLGAFGAMIISSVDNFLRPKLVAGRVGLNELVMFFAVLGGLQMFGILGIVLGPVVFAVGASLVEVLRGPDASPQSAAAAGEPEA